MRTLTMTHAPLSPDLAPRAHAVTVASVAGVPRVILRLEGALVLLLALLAYRSTGAGMATFFAVFLAPDLSMLAYLFGPRPGARAYNLAHTYLAPAALAALSLTAPAVLPYAFIWAAHVGFDRMLGYGLKYESAFGDTHLGQVGRRPDTHDTSSRPSR